MENLTETLDEIKRIVKPYYADNGTILLHCIPACDCVGGNPLNTCNSKCRINIIYRKINYLRGNGIPTVVDDIDEAFNFILLLVNELDIDDVMCPICMERMPFFAGCPKNCHISLCVQCAKKQNSCMLCGLEYPQYLLNSIKRRNENDTIIR